MEQNFGFMSEIKNIPNYLHGHTVSAMLLNIGQASILILLKKGQFKNFFLQITRL